jgi:aminopeptidase N
MHRREGFVATAAGFAAATLALTACTAHHDASPRAGVSPPYPAPVTPPQAQLNKAKSRPVEDPYYPQLSNPEIDTLHYNLALTWDGTLLSGEATVIFRATRSTESVRLDLSNQLDATYVAMDHQSMAYVQTGQQLVIDVVGIARDSQHTFTIDYTGTPGPVAAPSGRADMANGLGWSEDGRGDVYTFQEPWGAYTWYPVNDHPSDKALYDVQVRVPRGEVAVFNGRLIGHRPAPSKMTVWRWHVETPMASYLTTIAIGPYRSYTQTMPGGTPATYWVLPEDADLVPRLEQQARTAFSWLSARLGPYPFATFGIVLVGGDSGMETQTMITLSSGALYRRDAVVAHEIAHQWFGDAVTPRDWQGLWLNEGWAMYMQQWFERATGHYEYDGGIAHWWRLDNASRRRSGPPGEYKKQRFADLNAYLGPAMMLDAIRKRVGDVCFQTLARQWVADHEYGNVDRAEFVRWLDAKTGIRFDGLVHIWLDSRTTPR